ncbi:hypothetical protein PFMG_02491 [Plasmodium falciparum IGH-CR14]|uniref:Uncharacterized protein n=1 Tax=Plasmodium falciparum IGH-CR14 TaxID=580059 RepID=A0A0L1I9C5_PLAFA|nr:hypothetical protein PFMG_02491 [Plasmodium falciparum IGH-CR14]
MSDLGDFLLREIWSMWVIVGYITIYDKCICKGTIAPCFPCPKTAKKLKFSKHKRRNPRHQNAALLRVKWDSLYVVSKKWTKNFHKNLGKSIYPPYEKFQKWVNF